MHFSIFKSKWFLAFSCLIITQIGFSYNTRQSSSSSFLETMAYHQNSGGIQYTLGLGIKFFDGKINSKSTTLKTFDRTVAIENSHFISAPLSPDMLLSFHLKGLGFRRLISVNQNPVESTSERVFYEIYSGLYLTFKTVLPIPFFVGLDYDIFPKYTSETTFSGNTSPSIIRYSSHNIMSPRIGVLSESGNQTVAIMYKKGKEEKRKVSKTDNGETLSYDEKHIKPQEFSFLFKRGSGKKLILALDAIYGDKYNESTEQGYTESDTYSIFKAGLESVLMDMPYKALLSYKTISYRNTNQISIDGIPVTSLHFFAKVPTPLAPIGIDSFVSFGKDSQSLQEINSDYELTSFGLTIGTGFSF